MHVSCHLFCHCLARCTCLVVLIGNTLWSAAFHAQRLAWQICWGLTTFSSCKKHHRWYLVVYPLIAGHIAADPHVWLEMLMSCVLWCCSAMKRTGQVTFNGQKLNKRFKRQIGFVMQACDLSSSACMCASSTQTSYHTQHMLVHNTVFSLQQIMLSLCIWPATAPHPCTPIQVYI